MRDLNIYVTEKLRINKNTEIPIGIGIEFFIKVISELFDWEELKESENIKKLFKDMNISKVEDFKCLYRGTVDYPNKDKISKESKDFIEKYIQIYGKYSKLDRDKINDIITSPTRSELILDNGDMTKYVERYLSDDKIVGFSITDDNKGFTITGII